jgi:hypothetical protein
LIREFVPKPKQTLGEILDSRIQEIKDFYTSRSDPWPKFLQLYNPSDIPIEESKSLDYTILIDMVKQDKRLGLGHLPSRLIECKLRDYLASFEDYLQYADVKVTIYDDKPPPKDLKSILKPNTYLVKANQLASRITKLPIREQVALEIFNTEYNTYIPRIQPFIYKGKLQVPEEPTQDELDINRIVNIIQTTCMDSGNIPDIRIKSDSMPSLVGEPSNDGLIVEYSTKPLKPKRSFLMKTLFRLRDKFRKSPG